MDDVIDEYARKDWGVNRFSAGSPMCSLCRVVDKHYNAVMATSRDWQVRYSVDADSVPVAAGGRWGFRSGGLFNGLSRSPLCNPGCGATFAARNIDLS